MTAPEPPRRSLFDIAEQEGIAALIVELIRLAFGLLDPNDLKGTLPEFRATVKAIIREYGAASAGAALDAYERARDEELGRGGRPFEAYPADVAPDEVLDDAINAAVSKLWGQYAPTPTGTPPDTPADATSETGDALDVAMTNVEGIAVKYALNAGRDTTVENVQRDRDAQGWVREPEADACSFCLLLAIRGPVYKDGHVFDEANVGKLDHVDTPSDYKVHDHCRCHLVPVFGEYRMPADIRAWANLYKAAARTAGIGEKGNAFRTAVAHARRDGVAPQRPALPDAA